jgi:gliding motility-associated-like protein
MLLQKPEKNILLKYLCVVLMVLFGKTVHAQLTVDFAPSNGNFNGCSPLTMSFISKVQGAAGAVTYNWDLGNGNSSTLQNAGATYYTEKTYTVTLTVNDGTNTAKVSHDIIVYKKPVADFTIANAKNCVPFTSNFTSTSTSVDGTITKYFWHYGDGTTNNGTSTTASHNYTAAGQYSVALTVVSSFGCQSNPVQKNGVITALPAVMPTFAANKTTLCSLADSVSFTNNTTGPGTLNYTWDFGDGNTSTNTSPSHSYATKGNYTVKLNVTTSDGCAASYTYPTPVNAANYTSDFSVPALACANANVNFKSTSVPVPLNSQWSFSSDNYTTITLGNSVTRNFNTAGNVTVRLVNTFGTCTDTVNKTITVNLGPNKPNFIIDTSAAVCGSPATVKFTDTSSAAVKWGWDFNYNGFNPNITSALQAPSFTYNNDGSYAVYLAITDATGCTASSVKNIAFSKPNVALSYTSSSPSGSSGCNALTLNFSSFSSNSTIATWLWDFGDGATSASPNPTHTYSTVGTYTVKLTFTTTNGCSGTTTLNSLVRVYQKPKADFTAANTTICGNMPAFFTDGTTPTATGWRWDFGDNTVSFIQNPVHQYNKDTTYTVTLIAYNGIASCADTMVKQNYIQVLPPFPKIASVQNTCNNNRDVVTFTETSKKTLSWQWDFGDGSAPLSYTTYQPQITHTYPKTGAYKVVLNSTNGPCSVSDSTFAYVLLKQNPVLTLDTNQVCASGVLNVHINGLEPNPSNVNSTNYSFVQWQYGDGSQFTVTNTTGLPFATTYNGVLTGLMNGKNNLRVILSSALPNICNDTSNYAIVKIKGTTPGFAVTTNNVCYKMPVVFTDTSHGNNNVPIISWQWNFGDGTIQTYNHGGVTPYTYGGPNTYSPSLKVTDAEGCFATFNSFATTVVNGPQANFTWNPINIQPNIAATFFNQTLGNGNYSFKWKFTYDGFTSTSGITVPRNYPGVGVDTVTLIAINNLSQCRDTVKKIVYIRNINTAFTYTVQYVNNNSCPPAIVYFNGTTTGNVVSVKWDFGDGSTAVNNPSPSHTYNQPGVYKITLYGYDNKGNVVATIDSVAVKGPYAILGSDITQGCSPSTVTLNAIVKNASQFTWDFGDGTLLQSTDTFATHLYATPGVYQPALIMHDAGGCNAVSQLANRIFIDTLHTAITPGPVTLCDSSIVNFNTNTYNILTANNVANALTYHWNFGTGNVKDTANTATPSFNYNALGKYAVKLHIISSAGCVFDTVDSVLVKQSSKGIISGPAEVCDGLPVQYSATPSVPSNNIVWQWIFNNGNTDNKQNPSAQTFKSSITPYDVMLITMYNGCNDTTHSSLLVRPSPVINLQPKAPVICLGKSVQLSAQDGITYQWTPATQLSSTTIASPVASPVTTTQYTVNVTNAFSCVSTDSVIVKVQLPLKLDVSKDTFVCVGSSVQLRAGGTDNYLWIAGVGDLNNSQIGNPVATPKNNTTYTVVGSDKYGCFTDTANVNVSIEPLPTVKAATNNIVTPVGSTVPLSATGSNDVARYIWDPSSYLDCTVCQSPVSSPRSNITYTVTAITNYGCIAKDTVSITLVCVNNTVFIPTGFTPNGDQLNDIFYPMGRGIKSVKHFIVFNRYGEKIFERQNFNINDKSAGWNGKYKGYDEPAGAYVYMIELECDTGELFTLKGTVTLIR